jgi:hypothetical protein
MGDHAVVTRHEFLQQLHEILKPSTYLEIGVQSGASLALAQHSKVAIGIDPAPVLSVGLPPWAKVLHSTSDEFFALGAPKLPRTWPIDLAFIDGMHLWEYALRDFMNIEKYSTPDTVVVFDDVLPYNQEIAARQQPPGDWTGDVWKLWYILTEYRPDLDVLLVDTAPTGLMVVKGLDPGSGDRMLAAWTMIKMIWGDEEQVPEEILKRSHAITPSLALNAISTANRIARDRSTT